MLSSSGWLSASFCTATNARLREQLADLVRRHAGGDAAVGDGEQLADLRARNRALDARGDPCGLRLGERLVARERLRVLPQRLVRHARAGGLEALDPARVARRRSERVLDHHRHELRARQPEQRGIRLRDAPVRVLRRRRRSTPVSAAAQPSAWSRLPRRRRSRRSSVDRPIPTTRARMVPRRRRSRVVLNTSLIPLSPVLPRDGIAARPGSVGADIRMEMRYEVKTRSGRLRERQRPQAVAELGDPDGHVRAAEEARRAHARDTKVLPARR